MKKKKRRSAGKPVAGKFKKLLFSAVIALLASIAFIAQESLKEAHPPQPGQPAALYANQTDADLTHSYTSAIGSAKQSVLLVVYALTDPHIIASLQKKSREGVDVRVICDAQASPYIDSKLGSAISTTRRFGPGLMHQKMLVIDGQQTWIGSANMTSESLRTHGNLVTAFDNSLLAQLVTNKANTLKTEGKGPDFPHEELTIGDQPLELWFLPDNRDAVHRLKSLIRSAKKTIRIAMFTWTRQDLANAVIDATHRGVDAEVVIDHYSGKGASAKIVALLKKRGVKVALSKGGPLLHHKFLYIDGQTLVNGSANWTKAAFSKNDDCFMIIHDLTERQKAQMDALWLKIKKESEE